MPWWVTLQVLVFFFFFLPLGINEISGHAVDKLYVFMTCEHEACSPHTIPHPTSHLHSLSLRHEELLLH